MGDGSGLILVGDMDAENRLEKIRAAIERLGPTDHACTLYDERGEEAVIAASYIRAGLERGELCVCVVDDGRQGILDALESEGVDAGAELRKGRLAIFEKPLAQDLRTRDMLGIIEDWAKGARSAGHTGFRIVGEMTWALDGDLRDLAEFEARLNLNRVWQRHACAGLCQFDVRRFTPRMLREMIIVHPLVVIRNRICRNPYYVPPEQYLSPDWPLHEADWMMKNLEQLQQAQDSLQATQESYRSLSRRLVALQETERRDISHELHDRVGQTLTAMRINMDLIRTRLDEHDDALIRARNEDSLRLLDSAFKTVQDVMYELRPPMLDEYGVVAPLRWYAKQFSERTGIRVEIRGVEGRRFGAEVEVALFRIVQEALNNVARHSHAKNVRIGIRDTAEETVLTVEDDGAGLDPVRDRPDKIGYGLITMRERAEAVGGAFQASSEKGRGMRITVRVPRTP
jgi:signal transduction histidine kinase